MIRFFSFMASLVVDCIVLPLPSDAAVADKRVALIIGEAQYQNAPTLLNPARDASAMADLFRNAGFEVQIRQDLGIVEFKREVRQFEDIASDAAIAVVYYAGHGIELNGVNYLIPVDAKLASDRDAEDEALRLERLVDAPEGPQKLRLIILDACRDNPFVVKMKTARGPSRSIMSGGLANVKVTNLNTLVAYAAADGAKADDGDGEHSPFTTALLHHLTEPGLDIRLALGRVRDEVDKATQHHQVSTIYGSLGGDVVSLAPPRPSEADIKDDFDRVQKIRTREAWELFLNYHPTGTYAEAARVELNKLPMDDIRRAMPGVGDQQPMVGEVPSKEDRRSMPALKNPALADWETTREDIQTNDRGKVPITSSTPVASPPTILPAPPANDTTKDSTIKKSKDRLMAEMREKRLHEAPIQVPPIRNIRMPDSKPILPINGTTY
jgi:hypothetical protein